MDSPHGSRRSTGSIHSAGDERSRSADAGSTGSAEKMKNGSGSGGGGVKFSADTPLTSNEKPSTFTRMDTPHHLAGVRIVQKEEEEEDGMMTSSTDKVIHN